MENVEISTTHLDGVPFTPNLSYAQNLTQIADFYHNFITVDTIGIKIYQKTCKTQLENISSKYRIRLTRRFYMTGSFIPYKYNNKSN